jgi:BASS family bile acid:Na+ symporter
VRTLAIEVGMQNSGLAVALTVKCLASAAALVSAIFSIWHNPSGSLPRRGGDASKNEFLLSI